MENRIAMIGYPIRGLIFDLDGVYFEGGTKELLARYPVVNNDDLMGLRDMYDSEVLKGRKTLSEFFERMSGMVKAPAEELKSFSLGSIRPIRGMPELVRALSRRYELGIISGIDEERLEYLKEKYAFTDPFKACVFSCEMRTNKPDPVMYTTALDRIGLLGEKCIYTDDNQEFLEPAKKLGMRTILSHKSTEQLKTDLMSLGVQLD